MGPLANAAKQLAISIQKYEDEKASEITSLMQSNKDLKARTKELEAACAGKDAVVTSLRNEIAWFRQKLLDAGSARPVTFATSEPELPREAKPIGTGKTAAEISKMAMAAVLGDPKERARS